MKIERHSAKWSTLFGHLDETWTTLLPSHQVLVDGLVDPSIMPPAGDDNNPDTLDTGPQMADILHSKGVREIHGLVQHGMRILVTEIEHSVSTGIVSNLEQALTNVMTPQSVGLAVPTNLVTSILTDSSGAARGVASALFAVGMSALSCAGPIGAAAAAIIGFATFIVKLFRGRKHWEEKQRKDQMRRAFQSLPPLQVGGSDSDEFQARNVFIALQGGSWTYLFSPRFDPKREWIGAPRNGGYGFAPGQRFDTKDEFGIDTGKFEASGGVGFNPATGKITSVVQVSLDPIGDDVEKWFKTGYMFPVKKAHVRDVGDFYQSTGRLCAVAWAMATQEHASPHLYKIDAGTQTTDRDAALHLAWRRYFGGAVNYIKINGIEWDNWKSMKLNKRGRSLDPDRPEFILGTGLGCVAGSWACYQDMRADPGYPPHQMRNDIGLYSGCVIQPRQALQRIQGRLCLVSLYDGQLNRILTKVRERQEEFLYSTLVSAYVSAQWDAFRDGGDGLYELLLQARDKLLKNKDALAAVKLQDVLKTEKHRDKNWYELLKQAGAGKLNLGFQTRQPGAIRPPSGPPPAVPEVFAPPFEPDTGGSFGQHLKTAAKVVGGAYSIYAVAQAIRRYANG